MKANNENTPRSPLGHLESDIEMEKIYDNEDVNLTDIADKLLEELEEDFESDTSQSPKIRKLLYVVLVCSVIGGFSALAYYAYQFGRKPVDASQLQLVKADNTPYKEKPADPGGMEVPNMDKTIYDSISGKQNKDLPKVERILPPPEEPMTPNQVVYESVTDNPADAKSKKVVTNSHEALLANKALENNEIKPVVVKQDIAAKPQLPKEAAANKVFGLKPVQETDLKTVPSSVKSDAPLSVPAKKEAAKYRIQLGAYRSESDAAKDWKRLTKQYPSLLQNLSYFIERKDLGEKGIFYRLQAGPFDDSGGARMACKKLIENKQGCFFVEGT